MQERQERRKARLDASRRGTRRCSTRSTRRFPPARCSPRARWREDACARGPFPVLARSAPNTYRLDKHAAWRVFPEFNVERLCPYLRCPARLGGDADVGPPLPAAGSDGLPEHEVLELLKFKMRLRPLRAGALDRPRRGGQQAGAA